jgi:hypothetical protein
MRSDGELGSLDKRVAARESCWATQLGAVEISIARAESITFV